MHTCVDYALDVREQFVIYISYIQILQITDTFTLHNPSNHYIDTRYM